jgi:hypothetical protein
MDKKDLKWTITPAPESANEAGKGGEVSAT